MDDGTVADLTADFLGKNPAKKTAADDSELTPLHADFLGEPPPAPPPDRPQQSLLSGITAGIARGGTFGYAPKGRALLDSYTTGRPYDDLLAEERQKQADFHAQHPLIDTASELGGSIATGLPGAARVMAATAVPKILRLAGVGAVSGGLSGGGNTDGSIADQAKGAGEGAAIGAIVAPPASYVANTGLNIVQNRLVQPLLDRFGASGATNAAARTVNTALERDNIPVSDVQNKLATLGPQAAVIDTGGRNLLNLGGTIANTPGAGAQTGEQFLENRALGQGARLNQAINSVTGTTTGYPGFHATIDDLMAQRQAAAQPAYAKAYAQTPTNPDRINEFLASPLAQDGMQRGIAIERNLALANGQPFDPAAYGLGPDLKPIPGQAPNMRLLDVVKRGMDDTLEKYRNPVTGKLALDGEGRSIDQVRRAYVNELDAQNPDYAAARQAYSGPSQSIDALNMGRAALKNDPEVTAKIVGNLNPGDRSFFLNGVAQALKDTVDRTGDANDSVRKIFGNEAIRGKLRAAFDNQAAYDDFEQQMQAEAQFAKTRNDVLKGSPTSRREASREDQDSADSIMNILRQSRTTLGAGVDLARYGYNKLIEPSPGQSGLVGNMLFNPANNQDTIDRLIEAARTAKLNAGARNALSAVAATTAGQQRPGYVKN